MGNLDKDELTKPMPANRVSVLFVLSLMVILAVIALAGWGYFSQKGQRPATTVSASTSINAPIELPAATPESTALQKDAAQQATDSSTDKIPDETTAETDDTSKSEDNEPPAVTGGETAGRPLSPSVPEQSSDASSEQENTATANKRPQDSTATTAIPDSSPPGTRIMSSGKTPEETTATETMLPPPGDANTDEKSVAGEEERNMDGTSSSISNSEAAQDSAFDDTAAPPPIAERDADSEQSSAPDGEQIPVGETSPPSISDSEEARPITAADESHANQTADAMADATTNESLSVPESAASAETSSATDGRVGMTFPAAPSASATQESDDITEPDEDAPLQAVDDGASEKPAATETISSPPVTEPMQAAGPDTPRIAIIISELGMSNARARQAIERLPAAITFSFNPYGHNLQQIADEARAAGHEILLQVPMEPMGYPRLDPGIHGLRTDLSTDENLARLDWILDRFTGYIGITNQMGSRFTTDADAITPILAAIGKKNLLYLDSRTAGNSIAAHIAQELAVPVAINNRFLDHREERATIDAHFAALESLAQRTGVAIGIAYPYEETFDYLTDWIKGLEGKGLLLSPISALVNKQETR
ncbi:MAG: hypothetical protein CMN55_07445 [Sneathiella sp.]|uniref:divergent polysaccharide deacetylase family protein n=1 Tax=Sneathiella sp. TaxID=1964365 RepID=UPI000C50C0BF|nr:divergent polysaccharide deacetylase family protein [Sneathiella sp.]MAL78935.1 hypothetical protein [Sneathiella sp.]